MLTCDNKAHPTMHFVSIYFQEWFIVPKLHKKLSLVSIPFIFSDHAGGNEKLVTKVTGLTVCGNDDRIGAMNKRVKHNDQFKVTCQFQLQSYLLSGE